VSVVVNEYVSFEQRREALAMGNCFAKQHIAVDDRSTTIGKTASTEHSRKSDTAVEDGTLTETEVDITLPLTPASTLQSLSPRQPDLCPPTPPPQIPPRSPQKTSSYSSSSSSAMVQFTMPSSSERVPTTTSRIPKEAARHSRAYQARLEKARHLQMALQRTPSQQSIEDSSASSPSRQDDDRSDPYGPSVRYSLSAESHTTQHSQLNDEFEASVSKGMIWAEMECSDRVLAVCLSRRKPSLNLSTPSLYLAVGSEDGKVTVTELLDDSSLTTSLSLGSSRRLGPCLSIYREGRIRSIDFSPDGMYLAIGGDDCNCAIYQLEYHQTEDTEKLCDLELCAEIQRVDRVMAVHFCPFARYLAVGGYDGTVAIISVDQLASADPVAVATIPRNGLVLCLDWSPDGQYLAIGGSDRCCALVAVGASWRVFREIRRSASVQAVKWYPNGGRFLAIGSGDVAIVERDTLAVKHEINLRSSARNGASPSRRSQQSKVNDLCWSPNGSYLVVSGQENKCSILETKSYAAIHEVRRTENTTCAVWGQQTVIAGIPRRYLVVGGEDRKAVILKAGLEVNAAASSIGDDLSSALSTASSYFSNRGDWVYNEHAFKDIDETIAEAPDDRNEEQNAATVKALAFSRGSRSRPSAYFALATSDGAVTVRSVLNWKIVTQREYASPIQTLAFSNGSRFLAVGCEDGKLYIVMTAPSWAIMTEQQFNGPISSLAFSRNNERLAVGCLNGILTFLSPRQGWKVVGKIDAIDSPILSVDWTSRNLAIGRQDGTVSIYDSAQVIYSSFCVAVADIRRRGPVRAVTFGTSSRFLVVGGDDGMISVYSSKGDWVLCHQITTEASVSCLKWSPSGRYLAYSDKKNPLKVIDTVFWAEVEEANDLNSLSPSNGGESVSMSNIAISQDGKRIAFCGFGGGTHIANSSRWDVVFSLHQSQHPREGGGDTYSSSSRDDIDPAAFLSD